MRVARELRDAGFRVLVVWECETANAERLTRRLERFLAGTPRDQAATKNGAVR